MGDAMEMNFEGLEMRKWIIATKRAWRVDEKNGSICLVIMCTPRIMVFKMSRNGFFVFSTDNSKKLVRVWARHLSAPRISF